MPLCKKCACEKNCPGNVEPHPRSLEDCDGFLAKGDEWRPDPAYQAGTAYACGYYD